jgi:thymidylate synthase ThyX
LPGQTLPRRPTFPAARAATIGRSVIYPVESFSEPERERLAPHFTNLDRPVFALVNLPETVKGALFARYSRYPGTLRRLFLDEFAPELPPTQPWDAGEGARAAQLYERIFVGYGDDSVAQLGGAHVACEWVSNVLTKILQRPRLAAYLEQSTRYISYDAPMPDSPGGYRYYRDPELGAPYEAAMDQLFATYASSLPRVQAWAEKSFPVQNGEAPAAHARAIKAKALDLLRGLLPASSLSHMGIFATGQTYEQLILHLLAHPLPEAQDYGRMLLAELKQVIPSFLARVERPERGGQWVSYLERRELAGRRWAKRLGLEPEADPRTAGPSVTLLATHGNEEDLLAALLFEASGRCEQDIRRALESLDSDQRAQLLADLVSERANRRHRPGRGLEALRYRFEIVADYGAFRDLQRHRLLTVQWQALTPDLGAEVPEQVELAGCGEQYRRALELSAREYERLQARGVGPAASYALCLGYRIRFILDLNAREAMQLIELRSGREGHPSYRAVAHEMHAQIAAVHPAVAAAMVHIDRETEPRLERIAAELRAAGRDRALPESLR